jgi:phosphatidylglycerol:prolipoprotein diacylglycerol transferase
MNPILFKVPWINFEVPAYGAMEIIALLGAVWWMTRIATRKGTDPDIVLNMGLIVLVTSVIGARTFYVIHYWKEQFADQPLQILNLRAGGFEIYGGIIASFVACYLYLHLKRLPVRLYADMVTPPLLMAMGIGRIGCFMFGCCWGGTCPPSLPWAVQFPAGSPPHIQQWQDRLVSLPAELIIIDRTGEGHPLDRPLFTMTQQQLNERLEELEKLETKLAKAKSEGSEWVANMYQKRLAMMQNGLVPMVKHFPRFGKEPAELAVVAANYGTVPMHPAQMYAAIGPLLLAFVTYTYMNRRKWQGTVMPLGFAFYAVERFVEEVIRVDNPQDTFGLTVSQGISIGVLILCGLTYLYIRSLPPQSPRYVALLAARQAGPASPESGKE